MKTESYTDVSAAVLEFLVTVVVIFGNDWEYTLSNIRSSFSERDASGATFLEPHVADESNNWANRGAFLSSYRKLLGVLSLTEFHLMAMALNPDALPVKAALIADASESYWRDLAKGQQATIAELTRLLAEGRSTHAVSAQSSGRDATRTA